MSASDTSTVTTALTTSLETVLPCSWTATGGETATTVTTTASSCDIVTPPSALPANPAEWPRALKKDKRKLNRRDPGCHVLDFVIYPKATDRYDPSFLQLLANLYGMERKSGNGYCDYVVVESTQINFVAFVYVQNCQSSWLDHFSGKDVSSTRVAVVLFYTCIFSGLMAGFMAKFNDNVELAYDWAEYISLNMRTKPDPVPEQGRIDKRLAALATGVADVSSQDVQRRNIDYSRPESSAVVDQAENDNVTFTGLNSRALYEDVWVSLWEHGQMTAKGPSWLRNPEVYRSKDNQPEYNYIYDDLSGEGELIYVLDVDMDISYPVITYMMLPTVRAGAEAGSGFEG